MRIYFTASFAGGGKNKQQYKKLIKLLSPGKNHVLGQEVLLEKPEVNGDQKKHRQVFEREKNRIENADAVVAEVSHPSFGVGSEISYALILEKPVLALFYKDSVNKLSPMIRGNPSDSLYLEHYDNDNMGLIVKKFLQFVKEGQKKKGRLIVIEGADGSGKATQTKMLADYLKARHAKFREIEFPRYYTSFHGEIVARFHRGEFGTIDSVSPYLISLAYALDRLSARDQINDWLKKGHLVIANRYVPSSLAHQAAKLPEKEREKFVEWLDELEYRVHKMPREDLVIYLHVPWQIGQKLSQQTKKTYLNGKKDIAEINQKHMRESEKMYNWLLAHRKNWIKIDCLKNGKMRSKEEIQREIRKIIEKGG
ncbi:MAG: nucleoside 2-deoxyribosyltransferase [Patescibacteria group bacterium]|nr:nucleoside 2-deoxyribosyltransferase [Patescibacteria group bacterium]